MPTVPYTPVPTEKPNEAGIRGVSVNTPGAAFGEGVGQAISGLGKVEEHVGDEIFKRAMALQELQNETEAKQADANYAIEVGKLHADFNSLQGVNAGQQALEKHSRDMQNLREQYRGSLSNPAVQKMFDGPSYQLMSRTIFNAAGHAATQVKAAANTASNARIDATMQEIFANSRDDTTFERLRGTIEGEVRSQAELHGWTEDVVRENILKYNSLALSQRIIGMSKDNPFKARELFDEAKGNLRFADYERTENAVLGQVRTTAARLVSDRVNDDLRSDPVEGMKERTLAERIKEGETEAKRFGLKDEDMDFVRDRIVGDYTKHKAVVRDDDLRTRSTVEGAVLGLMSDGKKPTNPDELKAISPEVSDAWDKMKPSEQRRVAGLLAKNAKEDYPETPESRDRYLELLGLRQSDPSAFMDVNLADEKLPFGRRTELYKLQQAAMKNAEADPKVTRAYGLLSRQFNFEEMGLTKAKDATRNARFMGSLQLALADWRDSHGGKPPTDDEVKGIGTRLLQELYRPPMTIFGRPFGVSGKDRLFEMSAPEEFAKRYRADPKFEGRITPADEEVRQAYIRMRLKELEEIKTPVRGRLDETGPFKKK